MKQFVNTWTLIVAGVFVPDMVDLNTACAANVWTGNAFKTDVVHGVPDGGPKAGCIR